MSPRPVLLLLLLIAGCAADPRLEAELQDSVRNEIGRRPEYYRNGEARAWSVRKDGTERGLIWGTFHIAYSNETVLPAAIRTRFYAAHDLTVETVLDRVPNALSAMRASSRAADTTVDPKALAALDPGVRASLDAVVPDASSRNLSLRGLATLVRNDATQLGPQLMPNVGFVDSNLISFARQQNRPVFGLERAAIVDPTLDRPNGPEAASQLDLELRRAPDLRAMGARIRALYGQGEIDQTSALLAAWRATPDDLRFYDALRARLLTERNAAWLPRLVRLFNRPGDHFVAVGAGHLPGDDGIVALLRGSGFQVVPCPRDACPG